MPPPSPPHSPSCGGMGMQSPVSCFPIQTEGPALACRTPAARTQHPSYTLSHTRTDSHVHVSQTETRKTGHTHSDTQTHTQKRRHSWTHTYCHAHVDSWVRNTRALIQRCRDSVPSTRARTHTRAHTRTPGTRLTGRAALRVTAGFQLSCSHRASPSPLQTRASWGSSHTCQPSPAALHYWPRSSSLAHQALR